MVCIGSSSDVLLAGGGPAGVALAAELGERGLSVCVVDQDWGETWPRSFGSWAGGLPTELIERASAGVFARPLVTFESEDRKSVAHSYVRFETSRLQAALVEKAQQAGAEFVRGSVQRAEAEGAGDVVTVTNERGEALGLRARVVVDCSGGALARGERRTAPPAFQSAFGAWMRVARSPFEPGEMSLMDLRDAASDGLREKSFLYALPEQPGVLFAQETVLASRRPVSMKALEARLYRRLEQMGVQVEQTLESERCVIPLGLPPPKAGDALLSFGAAASLVQPSSGYCLASILRLAPRFADAIASELATKTLPNHLHERVTGALWPSDARRAFALQRLGLETLLGWSAGEMRAFWRAFFDLPGDTAPRFMDGRLDASGVASAMLRVFFGVPLRSRLELVQGGARFLSRATSRGFS